jgi:hypothetical protein
MTTQQDEHVDGVMDQFKALSIRIAALSASPPNFDRTLGNTIKGLFRSGEGVLDQLRPGPTLVGKNTKRRMRGDGELSSSGEREHGCFEEGSARPVRKPDQTYTDDPNRKGSIGENKGVGYLQYLSPLVVSPSLLCSMCSNT